MSRSCAKAERRTTLLGIPRTLVVAIVGLLAWHKFSPELHRYLRMERM